MRSVKQMPVQFFKDIPGRSAQWIRPRLQFCGPRFESQAHHLSFYIVKFCATFVIELRKGRK